MQMPFTTEAAVILLLTHKLVHGMETSPILVYQPLIPDIYHFTNPLKSLLLRLTVTTRPITQTTVSIWTPNTKDQNIKVSPFSLDIVHMDGEWNY